MTFFTLCDWVKQKKSFNQGKRELINTGVFLGLLAICGCSSFDIGERSKAIKAGEVEAKINIASLNNAQLIYFLEKKRFATKIEDIALAIPSDSTYYTYKILPQPDSQRGVVAVAIAKRPSLKSYVGMVFSNPQSELTFATGVCSTYQPLSNLQAIASTRSDEIKCPAGFNLVQ